MFDFNEKKRKTLIISAIIYAILTLFFIFVINFEEFSAFFAYIGDKLDIFSPIVIGAILAYLSTQLVRVFQNRIFHKMKRHRLKCSLSVLCAYLSVLIFILVFVSLIVPQLLASIEELVIKMTNGTYLNAAITWVNDFLNKISIFKQDDVVTYINVETITAWVEDFLEPSAAGFLQDFIYNLFAYLSQFVVSIKNIFLGLLISIYFVLDRERLAAIAKKFISALLPPQKCKSLLAWSKYADKTFGSFVIGKLIDAAFMMIICSIVFVIAKIPYAVLIATVIGISNIIPFFGPFIGAIPSGLIVLVATPSKFLLFCILLLVIQQLDANVVEPKIVGDKIGLSSTAVICAVIIMGGYFGILGSFFGVPIFVVICTMVNAWINSRLKKKDLTTTISDYYSDPQAAIAKEERDGFLVRAFRRVRTLVVNAIVKLWNFITKKESYADESTEDNEPSPEDQNS